MLFNFVSAIQRDDLQRIFIVQFVLCLSQILEPQRGTSRSFEESSWKTASSSYARKIWVDFAHSLSLSLSMCNTWHITQAKYFGGEGPLLLFMHQSEGISTKRFRCISDFMAPSRCTKLYLVSVHIILCGKRDARDNTLLFLCHMVVFLH